MIYINMSVEKSRKYRKECKKHHLSKKEKNCGCCKKSNFKKIKAKKIKVCGKLYAENMCANNAKVSNLDVHDKLTTDTLCVSNDTTLNGLLVNGNSLFNKELRVLEKLYVGDLNFENTDPNCALCIQHDALVTGNVTLGNDPLANFVNVNGTLNVEGPLNVNNVTNSLYLNINGDKKLRIDNDSFYIENIMDENNDSRKGTLYVDSVTGTLKMNFE